MSTATSAAKSKSKKFAPKSPEQRKAETDALRQQQHDAIMTMVTSEEAWTKFLQAGPLFRAYSTRNMLLILSQRPDATQVAGYKTWQQLGRKITSGPGSSLKIWGRPYHPKMWVNEDEASEDTAILERKDGQVKVTANFTRCPILSVFDISQTDGDPLPEIAPRLDDGGAEESEVAQRIIDGLTVWLTIDGWEVTQGAVPVHGANGATIHQQRQVVIADNLSLLQHAKTLLHEAAHVILHGPGSEWVNPDQYRTAEHRGTAEMQAESVAYVVAGMLGLDTSQYSTGYVAGWAARAAQSTEPDALLAAVERTTEAVSHGVNTLLDVLAPDTDQSPETTH